MNETFVKTLEALENAEKEMSELWDQLEALEMRMEVPFDDVEIVSNYKKDIERMTRTITQMLEKREKKKLDQLRLQAQKVE